jgi:hypothetical protein
MENLKKLLSSGKVKLEPVTGDEIAARIKRLGSILTRGALVQGFRIFNSKRFMMRDECCAKL